MSPLPATMRQAWYDRNGPADVITVSTVERPDPSAGEVLVRIHASGINPSDCKQRKGWPGRECSARIVPHSDGAGLVVAAGTGAEAWIGRRVWIWNARNGSFYGVKNGPDTGTAGEYVVLPANRIGPLPDDVTYEVGASLGAPACTAHHLVFADGDPAGLTILVQGGAGAVGELAVAFATHAHARVITTVSSPEKAEIARRAGAHHVIDYRQEDIAATVRALAPDGVDRVIEVDFAANIGTDIAVLQQNGRIASYSSPSDPEPVLPYYALQFKGITVQFVQGYSLSEAAQHRALEAITAGLAGGWLRPTIAARYSLEKIADAHRHVERGAIGNVVLMP